MSRVFSALLQPGQHVVISSVEHEAIMRPLRMLMATGIEVTTLPCSTHGLARPTDIIAALRPSTRAIIVAHASSVTGALQPLNEISAVANGEGVLLKVDTAPTIGVYPIDLSAGGLDALVFSGHKGPLEPIDTGGVVASSAEAIAAVKRATG
jgi:selenocysteine lyase/cysteine desulfurase